MAVIQYSINTRLGKFSILEKKEKVIYIGLPNCKNSVIKKWCKNHIQSGKIIDTESGQTDIDNQINDFLNGKKQSLTFPYKLFSTPFRKKVLEPVSKIPYGQTRSYKKIAMDINSPNAVRAVGGANGSNPLPLVIPCHRVIAQDGSLGGYGGGLDLKLKLLELEGWI